jgi:uncharacterized membrane protein YphA (DoxX/SURF4 family)
MFHVEHFALLSPPRNRLTYSPPHRRTIVKSATPKRFEQLKGFGVNNYFLHSSALLAIAIPREVWWSYLMGDAMLAIGLATMFVRGDWQRARGYDKLILFGPLFYAAPIAAFGTEHFTFAKDIASIIPPFVPFHLFLTYFIGVCFIFAALSLVTGIQTRLAATLLALNFFLFVALMDVPGWLQNPRDRIAFSLALRELAFCGGPLALAASLTPPSRRATIMATVARYFIAVPVVFYSYEQFLHGPLVPAVPLQFPIPDYIYGHSLWTYLCAVGYAIGGVMLLIGRKTRAAATFVGATVLFIELVVYVPIAIVERASVAKGLNFFFDTLMFCGTVLLLAGAMPREEGQSPARSAP